MRAEALGQAKLLLLLLLGRRAEQLFSLPPGPPGRHPLSPGPVPAAPSWSFLLGSSKRPEHTLVTTVSKLSTKL